MIHLVFFILANSQDPNGISTYDLVFTGGQRICLPESKMKMGNSHFLCFITVSYLDCIVHFDDTLNKLGSRLAQVLKTFFHQCVISYTCSQSNSDGS